MSCHATFDMQTVRGPDPQSAAAICGAGATRAKLPEDFVTSGLLMVDCPLCKEELARLARMERDEHPHLTISRLRQELAAARGRD